MYAESNEYLQEAAESVYELTQEEKIRQQCEAREDYRRRTVGRERMLKEALEENQRLHTEKDQWTAEKQQLSDEKQQLSDEKQQLSDENHQLSDKNQQLSDEIQRLQQILLEHGIETQ